MGRIAFIGLGHMGMPMAENLLKAGHQVCGVDTSSDVLARWRDSGGRTSASVGQAVADADYVVTMLPAGQHVKAVYEGPDGILAHVSDGCVLIDSSTIDVATARHVGRLAAEKGLDAVDAPVSGGVAGATAGTLTFMVGGSTDAFDRCEPILQAMGKNVVHAGPSGTGQAAKLCNNMLLAITMVGTCEAFALADRLGLDRQRFFDIASTASGQSWSMTSYCPVPGPVPNSPANRDYEPGFAAALMLKDLRLALEAAENVTAQTPLGRQCADIYGEMERKGDGAKDFSGIFRHFSELT